MGAEKSPKAIPTSNIIITTPVRHKNKIYIEIKRSQFVNLTIQLKTDAQSVIQSIPDD